LTFSRAHGLSDITGETGAGIAFVALRVGFQIGEHLWGRAQNRDVPMSLADGCIVRMTELHNGHALDSVDAASMNLGDATHRALTTIYPDAHVAEGRSPEECAAAWRQYLGRRLPSKGNDVGNPR
jgi:hypothetical protein